MRWGSWHISMWVCANYSPSWLRTWRFPWHVHCLLLYVRVGLGSEQEQRKWRLPDFLTGLQRFVQFMYWFSVWLHSDSERVNVSITSLHLLSLFSGKSLAISMVSGNVMSAKNNKNANAVASSISRNGFERIQCNWTDEMAMNGTDLNLVDIRRTVQRCKLHCGFMISDYFSKRNQKLTHFVLWLETYCCLKNINSY